MKKAYIKVSTMLVEVEVVEHKKAFGHDRCVIRPVAGKGQVTVSSSKVILK